MKRARPSSGSRRATATRRARAAHAAPIAPAPVTAAELRALRQELRRQSRQNRWNPNPEEVQRSVAQLVLTIVEFLRKLMERQAIRRMEQKTLTRKQVEEVGLALMRLEETIRDLAARFGLGPDDLNLDLGPLGKLM